MKENITMRLMRNRLGIEKIPQVSQTNIKGISNLSNRLQVAGGFRQQERMIRDKQRSLREALKFSYQGAYVRRLNETCDRPARALINPNRLLQDYDDKVISIGFEHNFEVGDIFEWINTNTFWLVYLQNLTELSYFKANIRRCSYQVSWKEGEDIISTYVAVIGPSQTQINTDTKHDIIIDSPNYLIKLLIPKNEHTIKQFIRYRQFFLDGICWRVEAVDSISMPNIIEISAAEYYIDEFADDIENGIVDGLIIEPINPNKENVEEMIVGDTFIKPKKYYNYEYTGKLDGDWVIDKNAPVEINIDGRRIRLKWQSNFSGQFDLTYGDYTKTIVVESLF